MDKNIEDLAKSCLDCQAVKRAPPVAPLQPWEWPCRVLQRVHVDFAGPFQGTMCFVAVDAYSKWPFVTVMNSTTVEKTIDALRQLFATYGIPEQLISDNGSQFTSEAFAVFLKMNGVRHTRSAPYHPATNGLAERFVQSLKQGLKASLSSGLSLHRRVCSFLLTYRSTVHSTTGVTLSSLFLKRELRTRFDLLRPDRKSEVARKQAQQKDHHDRRSSSRKFSVGDLVMAKNFRAGPDWVPATIVARLGPLSYLVETQDKLVWRRHVDHVKLRTVSPVSQPPSAPEPESECVWESAGSGPRGSVTNPSVAESEQEQAPDSNDSEQESSSVEDSRSDTNSILHTTESQPSVIVPSREASLYPQRERQAPAYYRATM